MPRDCPASISRQRLLPLCPNERKSRQRVFARHSRASSQVAVETITYPVESVCTILNDNKTALFDGLLKTGACSHGRSVDAQMIWPGNLDCNSIDLANLCVCLPEPIRLLRYAPKSLFCISSLSDMESTRDRSRRILGSSLLVQARPPY